jgi:DNA-binding CsgD family transcriptional regulator
MARLWTSVVASAGAEAYAMPTHTADGLSVRGRQVLQVIAESNATKAIAVRLGIGVKSVTQRVWSATPSGMVQE